MLIIRSEQLDTFTAYMERRAVVDAMHSLRLRFSVDLARTTDGELEAAVIRWLDQAAGYGLLLEGDLLRYMEIVIRLGEDPGTRQATAWADEILRRDGESGRYRLDQVEAVLGTE